MKHTVHLNLEQIEKWIAKTTPECERQAKFLEKVKQACDKKRALNDLDIALEVEFEDKSARVLCRIKNGDEIFPTSSEIDLYYAHCMANGQFSLEEFCRP